MLNVLRNKKTLLYVFLSCVVIALTLVGLYQVLYRNEMEIAIIKPKNAKIKIYPVDNEFADIDKNEAFLYEYIFDKNNVTTSVRVLPDPEEPINFKSREDLLGKIIDNCESEQPNQNAFCALENQESIFPRIIEISKEDYRYLSLNHKKQKFFYAELESALTIEELQKLWKQIKSNNTKALAQVSHYIDKKQVDDKFFYTLYVGKFSDFTFAKALCQKVMQNKQSCIIVEK